VPVSLIGTFGAMYLLGYSLDNLSLMALTVATGFVVDDAIVVLENITRHSRRACRRCEAALQGRREVGFTVLSMSMSLIAVFIPDPADGRHRRPAVPRIRMTLSMAILISLVDLADHHADDVRRAAAQRAGAAADGPVIAPASASSTRCSGFYRRTLTVGAAPSALDDADAAHRARPQRLSLRHHPEGLLPAAGHRPADRRSRPTRASRSS
jgi:hypothetical protein